LQEVMYFESSFFKVVTPDEYVGIYCLYSDLILYEFTL
jgi:hypothetical protein